MAINRNRNIDKIQNSGQSLVQYLYPHAQHYIYMYYVYNNNIQTTGKISVNASPFMLLRRLHIYHNGKQSIFDQPYFYGPAHLFHNSVWRIQFTLIMIFHLKIQFIFRSIERKNTFSLLFRVFRVGNYRSNPSIFRYTD